MLLRASSTSSASDEPWALPRIAPCLLGHRNGPGEEIRCEYTQLAGLSCLDTRSAQRVDSWAASQRRREEKAYDCLSSFCGPVQQFCWCVRGVVDGRI